jgi:hypothetical protein
MTAKMNYGITHPSFFKSKASMKIVEDHSSAYISDMIKAPARKDFNPHNPHKTQNKQHSIDYSP